MTTSDEVKFTSVRNKWNKYIFFTVIIDDDNVLELDCDTLIDHGVHDGLLYLIYEEEHKRVMKDWAFMEYALNKPQ